MLITSANKFPKYEPTTGHIPMGLYNRGTSYYEVINIPRDLIPMFNKKQLQKYQCHHNIQHNLATLELYLNEH